MQTINNPLYQQPDNDAAASALARCYAILIEAANRRRKRLAPQNSKPANETATDETRVQRVQHDT